jgi:hypothetical protein
MTHDYTLSILPTREACFLKIRGQKSHIFFMQFNKSHHEISYSNKPKKGTVARTHVEQMPSQGLINEDQVSLCR